MPWHIVYHRQRMQHITELYIILPIALSPPHVWGHTKFSKVLFGFKRKSLRSLKSLSLKIVDNKYTNIFHFTSLTAGQKTNASSVHIPVLNIGRPLVS